MIERNNTSRCALKAPVRKLIKRFRTPFIMYCMQVSNYNYNHNEERNVAFCGKCIICPYELRRESTLTAVEMVRRMTSRGQSKMRIRPKHIVLIPTIGT